MSESLRPFLEGYSCPSFEDLPCNFYPFVSALIWIRQPRLIMFKMELLMLTSPISAHPSHVLPMLFRMVAQAKSLLPRFLLKHHFKPPALIAIQKLATSPLLPSWFNVPSPLAYIVLSALFLSLSTSTLPLMPFLHESGKRRLLNSYLDYATLAAQHQESPIFSE